MRPKAGTLVYIDTNSIIEAHRTGCWKAISSRYDLETVKECEAEACTIPRRRTLDRDIVAGELSVALKGSHDVTDEQRAVLAVLVAGCNIPRPDPGERDLWSHILAHSPTEPWSLCGPDKTSVRIGDAAGFKANLTSLEALADGIGHIPRPPLRDHHTEKWLDAFLLVLTMEKLPRPKEPPRSIRGKFKRGR